MNTIKSLLYISERQALLERFLRARKTTEFICAPLEREDYVVQPNEDVSPPKWHLGHSTWFFEVFILKHFNTKYAYYNERYLFYLNSYYEHLGERINRVKRGHMTRPSVDEIMRYRQVITDEVAELIEQIDDDQWSEFQTLADLGINHEEQHQELLLMDIKFILGFNPLYPVYREAKAFEADRKLKSKSSFLTIPEGSYTVGNTQDSFSFDNESPSHLTYVRPYQIADRLVTNGEYLEFIEDGGYQDFRHWLSDGWAIVQEEKWFAPLYWERIEGVWHEYTLGGMEVLDPSRPVSHVSYYEAEAYASWRKLRLPTEFEWEVAVQYFHIKPESGNFMEHGAYQPIPPLASQSVVDNAYQFFGDVWEWTGSAYLPYPGYKHAAGALGEYNGKFMINQMVLRGGAWGTPMRHIRATYRNFYPPAKRWQLSGIRLAKEV